MVTIEHDWYNKKSGNFKGMFLRCYDEEDILNAIRQASRPYDEGFVLEVPEEKRRRYVSGSDSESEDNESTEDNEEDSEDKEEDDDDSF